MGLGPSVFSDILTEEPINTLLSSEIHSLTYEEFLKILRELNMFTKNCLDEEGNQLVFAVKKDTDSTVFWKATVQIACVKVNPKSTNKVLTYRCLTLCEFLKVFKTLKSQLLAAEQSKSNMTISNFMEIYDKSQSDSNECCICLERQQEVSLPCTHSYCMQCIEEWNESHDTCPICREKLESTDDTWVISDAPKEDEISRAILENLMELTEEKPSPCLAS